MSFARLGSVVAGVVEPYMAENYTIGAALWIGFGFCAFSWFCGLGIVICELYADKVDGEKAKLSDDHKIKCRQLKEFTLPFWLIVASCVTVYCSIFPYSWNTSLMLRNEFNVPK